MGAFPLIAGSGDFNKLLLITFFSLVDVTGDLFFACDVSKSRALLSETSFSTARSLSFPARMFDFTSLKVLLRSLGIALEESIFSVTDSWDLVLLSSLEKLLISESVGRTSFF